MPEKKEHCQSCRRRYGYDFAEVHTWMDEPITLYSSSHRKERHDKNSTPDKAEKIFWNKVPEEYRPFIRDAVLDHLRLDYKDNPAALKQESDSTLGDGGSIAGDNVGCTKEGAIGCGSLLFLFLLSGVSEEMSEGAGGVVFLVGISAIIAVLAVYKKQNKS